MLRLGVNVIRDTRQTQNRRIGIKLQILRECTPTNKHHTIINDTLGLKNTTVPETELSE